jgi:Mg2+/Co2+ transporter CorB
MNDREITAIIVFGIVCLPALIVPIVAMLIKHQQQMAKLLGANSAQASSDSQALKEELYQLKGIVHQQSILLDDLQRKSLTEGPPRFQERAG